MPGQTPAYGFLINKDGYELRSYQPDGLLAEASAPAFEAGREYTMTIGAYDEGDAVRLVMRVDGETVFEFLHESTNAVVAKPLNGVEGYLGVYTGPGLSAQVLPISSDKGALRTAIDSAQATVQGLDVGSRYGQYPQTAVDVFNGILDAAESVASDIDALQATVDQMISDLEYALNDLLGTKNTVGNLEAGETVDYDYGIVGRSTFNIPQDAKSVYLHVDPSREHTILVNKQIGGSLLTMTVAEGTKLTASGWDGNLLLPEQTDAASATVKGEVAAVYKLGGAAPVAASKPVRIVLPGMASYTIGYVSGGTLTNITEKLTADSLEAAEAALGAGKQAAYCISGNDVVVWIKQLTELVAYTPEKPEPTPTTKPTTRPTSAPPYNNGTVGTGTTSGTKSTTSIGLLGGDSGSKFVDITNHWAKDDIENLYAKGIVTGVTATTFEPDRSVTRAEFATLITKALNLTGSASAGFADVSTNEWHYAYVNAAANAGLIVGYDGYFRPDDLITREEMAVIIAKAFAYRGKTAGSGGIEKFTDKGEISGWAYSYVDTVTTAGLISGMTPTTFVAGANTTRAQAASVIRRLLDN